VERAHPKTIEEAVKVILSTMTDTEKELIRSSTEEKLTDFHLGLGTEIRNKLGLWDYNYELLISCGELEPDEASMVIIKAVWETLQNEQSRR